MGRKSITVIQVQDLPMKMTVMTVMTMRKTSLLSHSFHGPVPLERSHYPLSYKLENSSSEREIGWPEVTERE